MIEINGDTIAKGRTRYLTMPLLIISRRNLLRFPSHPSFVTIGGVSRVSISTLYCRTLRVIVSYPAYYH